MASEPDEHIRRSNVKFGNAHHSEYSPPPTPKELGLTASITSSIESSKYDGGIHDEVVFESSNEVDPPIFSFTRVETPHIGSDTFGDDFTAKALKSCKKTVLGPYNIFLKIIGWRRFSPSRESTPPLHYKVLNIVWPIILTALLIVSCVTQILICFSRDYIAPNRPDNNNTINIQCHKNIASAYIILDILLIAAYLYGVYIFRIKEPEHLSTFAETVFLGFISRRGTYSPKYLIRSLQFLMLLGLFWISYSMLISVVRIFAHHYFKRGLNVHLEFIPIDDTDNLHWVIGAVVIVSIMGFIVFDVAYTAVVINYCIQCQLMVYYIQSISTRIIDREWEIEQSIKEVHSARQFLSKLNSHMSKATGIMMFIFLTSSFNSIYGLEELDAGDYNVNLLAITTIFSFIQWALWLLLPLVQAARVTRSGTWLLKTALEMRSRPMTYKDTPQLDLDSFLLYCSNVQMKAKLFSVPISSGIVVGGLFVIAFVFYLVFTLSEKTFSWAEWL